MEAGGSAWTEMPRRKARSGWKIKETHGRDGYHIAGVIDRVNGLCQCMSECGRHMAVSACGPPECDICSASPTPPSGASRKSFSHPAALDAAQAHRTRSVVPLLARILCLTAPGVAVKATASYPCGPGNAEETPCMLKFPGERKPARGQGIKNCTSRERSELDLYSL